jgi:excisionase family DNA binding protein
MSTPALTPPSGKAVESGTDSLTQVLDFIEAHEARRGAASAESFYLSGAHGEDRVELAGQVGAILKQVVAALRKGQAISLVARDHEISTQQAAEILGISRPTVVRLINDGELPAHIPGSERRKLHLADVLAYRDELSSRRNRFIAESSAEYHDAEADDAAELPAKTRKAK